MYDLDTMDSATLEALLTPLVEELIWVEAHQRNLGSAPSEPRQTTDPLSIVEYLAFRERMANYREAYTEYMQEKKALHERRAAAAKSFYELVPAVWVIVPAFGVEYACWIANGATLEAVQVHLKLAEFHLTEAAAD